VRAAGWLPVVALRFNYGYVWLVWLFGSLRVDCCVTVTFTLVTFPRYSWFRFTDSRLVGYVGLRLHPRLRVGLRSHVCPVAGYFWLAFSFGWLRFPVSQVTFHPTFYARSVRFSFPVDLLLLRYVALVVTTYVRVPRLVRLVGLRLRLVVTVPCLALHLRLPYHTLRLITFTLPVTVIYVRLRCDYLLRWVVLPFCRLHVAVVYCHVYVLPLPRCWLVTFCCWLHTVVVGLVLLPVTFLVFPVTFPLLITCCCPVTRYVGLGWLRARRLR